MRINTQQLKDIPMPMAVEEDSLKAYLANLYGDPDYEPKDKAYVENTNPAAVDGYKKRAELLLNTLKELSGIDKFEELRTNFITEISPGETRKIVHDIKKTCEMICCKLNNLLNLQIPVPDQFKAEVSSAKIDACESGALTNLQIILFSLDSNPLYAQKYAFIHHIATEYVEEHKLYDDPGSIVHEVNKLIHEVSELCGVKPPKDVYAIYRDLSKPPTLEFDDHANFAIYLLDYLSEEKGARNFIEFLTQDYAGKLPDNPADGSGIVIKKNQNTVDLEQIKILPDNPDDGSSVVIEENQDTVDLEQIKILPDNPAAGSDVVIEKKQDTAAFEQIKMVCDILKIPMPDLCNLSNDGTKVYYKEDYLSIIEAAVISELINRGILESENLSIKETRTTGAYTKISKTTEGDVVREVVAEKTITVEKPIIKASDAWYLTSRSKDGKISIQNKILNIKLFKNLTISSKKFEDWLHDSLKPYLNEGFTFDEALSKIISKENNIDAGSENNLQLEDINLDNMYNVILDDIQLEERKANLEKELFLLSDQGRIIKKYLDIEDMITMSEKDMKKWMEFDNKLKKNNSISDMIKYIAKYGNEGILDTYLSSLNKTSLNEANTLIERLSNVASNNLLELAGEQENIDIIPRLISYVKDINKMRVQNMPILHWAMEEADIKSVLLLLDKGIDIEGIKQKDELLIYGYTKRHKGIISLLISKGCDLCDILEKAIMVKDIQGIKFLLEFDVDFSNKGRVNDLLYWAISQGNIEMTTMLIQKGADINNKYQYGNTPLDLALSSESTIIIKLLIDNGADVHKKYEHEKTLLDELFEKYENDIEILTDMLKGSKDPRTIVSLIEKSAGYLWDDERHWKIINSIVDSLPKEKRVDVVYEAVKLINNSSRRARLTNMLTKEEQVDLRRKLNLIKKTESLLDTLNKYGGFGSEGDDVIKKSFVEKEKEKRKNSFQGANR